MIIINLKGGLGNQMFQYATGRAISIKNKTQFKLDISGYNNEKYLKSETPREYELKDFNIEESIASVKEIKKLKYPLGIISKGWRFFRAKALRQNFQDYYPKILKKENYYLDGFWQSEKNFLEIRDILLKEFSLKTPLTINPGPNSLSIHVRHGDYLTNKKTNSYHGVLDIRYYKSAYNFIKEKTNISTVYIFTDDVKWAKENLNFISEETIFASNLNYKNSEEIILMSKCDYNIIANSSFSWWGAWLNQKSDKIVIAPKTWFKKGDKKHPNIAPKSWIRI